MLYERKGYIYEPAEAPTLNSERGMATLDDASFFA
jgi:hypothetical protein